MKGFSCTIALACISALPQNGAAKTPPLGLIVDSPVDYAHPGLKGAFDMELLKKLRFEDPAAGKVSWYELNQRELERLRSLLAPERLAAAARILESPAAETGTKLAPSELSLAKTFFHGTHVAGIAAGSPGEVRLINFPFVIAPMQGFSPSMLELPAIRERYAKLFGALAETVRASKIRLVNLSISNTRAGVEDALKSRASFWQRITHSDAIWRAAEADHEAFMTGFKSLVEGNPDTVFVLSAGNSGTDLAQVSGSSLAFNAPNLLKVAALEKGKLAPYSNFSSQYVQLAVEGTNVLAPQAGGGEIALSGTSQAAPKVFRELAGIFRDHPGISAQKAVEELKARSDRDPGLRSSVQDGLTLREPGPETGCEASFGKLR